MENLTDNELREKLLEIGYNLPVSINREFLIKKLKSVYENSNNSKKNGSRRKSATNTRSSISTSSPNHNAATSNFADLSWSRKSSPQEWSRYSSALPSSTPLSSPGMTTTTTTTLPSSPYSSSPNGSTSFMNSRLSLGGKKSFDPVTSADRHHASNTSHHTHSSTDRGHLISKILVGIAVLGFSFIAFLYLNLSNEAGKVPGLDGKLDKPPIPSPTPSPPSSSSQVPVVVKEVFSNNYPICGMDGVDSLACIPREYVKTARALFSTLKDELVQRAKWKGCSYNVDDKIPLNSAKSLLYRLSDKKKQDVDEAFTGMLILCAENPNWGLKIEQDESTELTNSRELLNIDYSNTKISATNISPSFICQIWGYVQIVFIYFAIFASVAAVVFIIYKGIQKYQQRKKNEENEVFTYIDNILQMLQEQYDLSKGIGDDPFLAVNHIRDALIPAKERPSKAALWNRVVDYISNNESRIREEIQHISGEEYRVWRWLPNASPLNRSMRKSVERPGVDSGCYSPFSTPPNAMLPSSNHARPPVNTPMHQNTESASASKWQGQAFELSDGSPNAVLITPTNCLKIRQMFDLEATKEERQSHIERAILEKCPNSAICHIGVDHTSTEGCVYVKCATKEDARKAYLALHGWWFDGHLLSVKFLREERYLSRFPDAKNRTTPMSLRHY